VGKATEVVKVATDKAAAELVRATAVLAGQLKAAEEESAPGPLAVRTRAQAMREAAAPVMAARMEMVGALLARERAEVVTAWVAVATAWAEGVKVRGPPAAMTAAVTAAVEVPAAVVVIAGASREEVRAA